MYTSLCRYLCVLLVLHSADVVGIFILVGFYTIKKNMPYAKGTIDFNHFLSIQYVHGDLCKHLEIDLSTDRIPIILIGTRIYS